MEARKARVVIAAGLGALLVSSAPVLVAASPVDGGSAMVKSDDQPSRQTIEVSTVEQLENAVNSATGPLEVIVTADLVAIGDGEGGALINLSNPNPAADVRVARKKEPYASDNVQVYFGEAEAEEASSVVRISDFAGKICVDNLSVAPDEFGTGYEDPYVPNIVHGLEVSNTKKARLNNLDVKKVSDIAIVIKEGSSCHIEGVRTFCCAKERVYVCGGSSLEITGEINHSVERNQEIAGEIVLEDRRIDSVSHASDVGLVDYRIFEDGWDSYRAYCTTKDNLEGSMLTRQEAEDELPVFSRSLNNLIELFGEGDTMTIFGGAECDRPIVVPAAATIRGDGSSSDYFGFSSLSYKSRDTTVPDTFVILSGDGARLEGLSIGSIFKMEHVVTVQDCKGVSIEDCYIADGKASPVLIDGAEASLTRVNLTDGFYVEIGGAYTSIELAMDEDSPTIPSLTIEDPTWLTGDYLKDVSDVYVNAEAVEAIRARLGAGATRDDVLAELGRRVTVDGVASEFKLDEKYGAYSGKKPWEWVEDTGDDEHEEDPDEGQGGSTGGDEDGSTTTVTVTNPDGSKTERTTEVVVGGDGTVVETVTELTSGSEGGLSVQRVSIEVTNRYGDVIFSKSTETAATPGGTTATTESIEGEPVSIAASISERDAASGAVELPISELDALQEGELPRISLNAPEETVVIVPVKNAAGSEVPPTKAVLAVVDEDGELTPCPKTAQVHGGLSLEVSGNCELELICSSVDFPDIVGEEWYAQEGVADFVSSRGILTGVIDGDGTASFRGGDPTTRAMFVTMLSRLELEPKADDQLSFSDVDQDSWYANAAAWGLQEEIVEGVGGGRYFGGEDVVTREQMAVFLMRYAQWLGIDTSARSELTFSDASSISSWARDAASWASAEGYLRGHGSGAFAPQDGASRAEASAVLMRFINGMHA